MSTSLSYATYSTEYDLMEKAIATPRGIRVQVGSDYGVASNYRYRLNAARKADRGRISQSMEPGTPGWGTSPYDELIFSLEKDEDGFWWVAMKRNRIPEVVEVIEEESER